MRDGRGKDPGTLALGRDGRCSVQKAPSQFRNEENSADCRGKGGKKPRRKKLIGKESKITKQRRKTSKRKVLERWWRFNWLLSDFFCWRKMQFRPVSFGRTAFLFSRFKGPCTSVEGSNFMLLSSCFCFFSF